MRPTLLLYIARPCPAVRLLTLICIALPVTVASSIWKPLPVWAPPKLKRAKPLLTAPVDALVSDIKVLASLVLNDLMAKSWVCSFVAPWSTIFSKAPVLLVLVAPAIEILTRLPEKLVMAPEVATLRREPIFEPAVVMPVEEEAML